jgi:hypothetical protein
MNNTLQYIIPDTSEPLATAEKEYLDTLQNKGGHEMITEEDTIVNNLVEKGVLSLFKYGDDKHVYDSRTCFIRTMVFKLKKFNLMKNLTSGQLAPKNSDEERKQFKSRKLLAYWVCGMKEINDDTAAFYFYLYTFRVRAVVSFPEFMFQQFEQDAVAADAEYQEITPKVNRIRCNICGHITLTRLQTSTITCEECGKTVST